MKNSIHTSLFCLHTVPYAPAHVSVTAVNTSSFTIEWNELECEGRRGIIIGYIIRYTTFDDQLNPVITSYVNVTDPNQLMYTLTGLTTNTTYQIGIAALNGFGQGPFHESSEYGFEIQNDGTVEQVPLVNRKLS